MRALIFVGAALCIAGTSQVLAISDDANPWLAIENAVCVSHRTVDYTSLVGETVDLAEVQWRGAAQGLPMHCYLAGRVGTVGLEIRLPTNWNRQIYQRPNDLKGGGRGDLTNALGEGYAVLFSEPTAAAQALLQAAIDHQYRVIGAEN